MSNNIKPAVSIVIQAGGRSSRMGRDKALVPLAGKPLIAHVIERVGGLSDDLLITTNRPDDYAFLGLPMASDAEPGAGALPGLQTALTAARGELVLLVACDMPFLDRDLLAYQLSLAPGADVVVARWADRLQPMHAVYRRDVCATAVANALAADQRRMISWFSGVRVHEVTPDVVARFSPDGRTFFNVNTPEELQAAEDLMRET